jgi:hypothetical protein
VSKRHGQHIVSGGFNCADADKDQRECSNEFREEWAKLGHVPISIKFVARWQLEVVAISDCARKATDQRFFFGLPIVSVCFTMNDFARAYSF